ncbi:MAG: hypothetical protein JXR19_10515 [Bacteroidia bacterium]
MKTYLLSIFLLFSSSSFAQDKFENFFSNLELSFSHSFEYDNAVNGNSDRFAQIAHNNLPNGSSDLGLDDYTMEDENPLSRFQDVGIHYCGGVYYFNPELIPDYNAYNLGISKSLELTDNVLSFGIDIGYRKSTDKQSSINSATLIFVNYNQMDSLVYQDYAEELEDTMVLVPAVSFASFSLPTTMISVGLSTKIRLIGNNDSKWRLFFSASYRRMTATNHTTYANVWPQYYYFQYDRDLPENWQNTYYRINHVNQTSRIFQQFELTGNKFAINSFLFGINLERQLFSEDVNWGIRCQFGTNTYVLNKQAIDTEQAGRIGGYLAFKIDR